jgi:hypothetical protein
MEVKSAAAPAAAGDAPLAGLKLVVLAATVEELADHRERLAEIDKASKGACLWTKLEKA